MLGTSRAARGPERKGTRVGFVSQPFDNGVPPEPGGSIGLLTWELARRLGRSRKIVVCVPRSGPHAIREIWEGVEFNRMRLKPDRWLLDKPRGLKSPVSAQRRDIDSILYYPFYAMEAAFNLRTRGCDIIHIHNFSQFLPIVRRLNPRAKLVLHMHCDWLMDFDWSTIDRRLRHADLIIGCANYITDRIRSRFPDYAARCATLNNGATADPLPGGSPRSCGSAKKRFVFVGRVSPEKGIHVLIDAFKMVLEQEPEATLKIVGGAYIPPLSFHVDRSTDPAVQDLRRFYESDYVEYLQKLAQPLPPGRVTFLGQVGRLELAALLKDSDVFMHPSVWGEPFPLAVVEAMAAGLPVVASRVGGLPESIVHGKTGLLVERDDPVALADAMLQLIRDNAMAYGMGAAGSARAKELFSWDVITAKLGSLYDALISEPRTAVAVPSL